MKSNVKMSWKLGATVLSLLRLVIIFGLAFIILKPFFIKIMMAFMSPDDLLDPTVSLIPRLWSTYYWKVGLEILNLGKTLTFTAFSTISASLLQLISSAMIAYGLARFKFPGHRLLYALVVVIMLIPTQVYSIAQYLRFWNWGLVDTVWPILIQAVTGLGLKQGLYIYLLLNFFKGLPKDLENAAMIDGATPFRTFFSVVLPNARTLIATVFLFSFSWQWTDSSFAELYYSEKLVMSTQIINFYIRDGLNADMLGSAIAKNAACLLLLLPLAVIFFVFQKSLVQSVITSGQAN